MGMGFHWITGVYGWTYLQKHLGYTDREQTRKLEQEGYSINTHGQQSGTFKHGRYIARTTNYGKESMTCEGRSKRKV